MKGFSLIEILITLLLISVGVLGMAALQTRTIQYTQHTSQRNNAIVLANEFVEIIRANPSEIFTDYPPDFPMNNGLKDSSILYKQAGSDFSERETCVINANNVATSAQEQRDCWADRVEALLQDGETLFSSDMYICRSASSGDCTSAGSMIEIHLAWRAPEDECPEASGSVETVCTYTLRVEP